MTRTVERTTARTALLLVRPPATVANVVHYLKTAPRSCQFVRHMPGGKIVEPREIWIEPMCAWVRADGTWILGDLGRGRRYPGMIGRWRIRRAVARWVPVERTRRQPAGVPA